jgi:hypothetical protein
MNEGNFKFEFSVTEISHHKRGKQIYFLRTILFFEWTNFIFISNQKIKEKRFIFVSLLVLSRLKKEKKTWGGNSGTHHLRWLGLSRGGVVVPGGGRREALSLDLPTKTPEVCLSFFCCSMQHAAAAPSSACSPAAFLAEVLHGSPAVAFMFHRAKALDESSPGG